MGMTKYETYYNGIIYFFQEGFSNVSYSLENYLEKSFQSELFLLGHLLFSTYIPSVLIVIMSWIR